MRQEIDKVIATSIVGDYRDWRRRLKAEFHWYGWGRQTEGS